MDLKIDKINEDRLILGTYKKKANEALDRIWGEEWLKRAISEFDEEEINKIITIGNKISNTSDVVIIIASGKLEKTISGIINCIEQKENTPEIIVLGQTLCSRKFSKAIEGIENKDFSVILSSNYEEPIEFICAYYTIRSILVKKYGNNGISERVYGIFGRESTMGEKLYAEDNIVLIKYPDEIPMECASTTITVLLPLSIKGVDIVEFLGGFKEMLSEPFWDTTGTDYAILKANLISSSDKAENFVIWQEQLEDAVRWQNELVDNIIPTNIVEMPQDLNRELLGLVTHLVIKDNQQDIMTPAFDGCNEDGSLNMLLAEHAQSYFSNKNQSNTKVIIWVNRLNSKTLGEIIAYLQLSNKVVQILLEN